MSYLLLWMSGIRTALPSDWIVCVCVCVSKMTHSHVLYVLHCDTTVIIDAAKHFLISSFAAMLRKRDRLKKVVKKVKGKVKGAVKSSANTDEEAIEITTTQSTSSPKGRRKKLNGKKYEKIDDLEEKAFQILLDLDMIQEHN